MPAIKFLVLAGLFRGLTGLGGWLFYAIGVPNKNFLLTGTRTVVLFALFIPLSLRFGIAGAALAVLCANLVSLMFKLYLMPQVAGIPRGQYLRAIALPLCVGSLAVGLAYAMSKLIAAEDRQVWPWLIALVMSGVAYGLYMLFAERRMPGQLASSVRRG